MVGGPGKQEQYGRVLLRLAKALAVPVERLAEGVDDQAGEE